MSECDASYFNCLLKIVRVDSWAGVPQFKNKFVNLQTQEKNTT